MTLISTRTIYVSLGLYFAVLLVLAPYNILSLDTYYYWDWSRHLALSYYDGSPMIAYFIKISTFFFGNNLFSLSFVGIAVAALTSALIYKTARFFLSRESSWVAMFSWLFSPLVTLDILKQTTYDTPLTLFWALTLYYTVKFIHTDKTKDLYFISVSAGLMLLSKYSGIVLILALLIFLVFSKYRSIFKIKHFYWASFLTLIIFSPVILWNYQNHWQSFIYQLTTHQLSHTVNPFSNVIKTFFISFVPALNIMLIPPFISRTQSSDKKTREALMLCRIICITFLCFYLFAASKSGVRTFWLTPYLISSALLFGYCFATFPYRKLALSLITLYALISLCILGANTSKYSIIKSQKMVFYHLVEHFNATHPHIPNAVFTSGWFQARMLFFLKNKPLIYTLGCGEDQNQYGLWSMDIHKKIVDKTLKEALYIDRQDRRRCLEKYFDACKKIPTITYLFGDKKYSLNAYRCHNF